MRSVPPRRVGARKLKRASRLGYFSASIETGGTVFVSNDRRYFICLVEVGGFCSWAATIAKRDGARRLYVLTLGQVVEILGGAAGERAVKETQALVGETLLSARCGGR